MRSITLFFVAAAMMFFSCGTVNYLRESGKETLSATAFKEEIPFTFPLNQSILIPVYFEKEQKTRTLKFDNHASFLSMPTPIVAKNTAFKSVGKFFLSIPTPEGKSIPNIFYLADSLKLGNMQFGHILTNGIPGQEGNVKPQYEGLFGKNLMVNAVWKIDFERNLITMASSIDSINEVKEAQKLIATFTTSKKIKINIAFENKVEQTVDVDLGYSGSIVLTPKGFKKIDPNNKAVASDGTITSVMGVQKVKRYTLNEAQIKIGDKAFITKANTNNLMKMNLLGISFFSKFKFVIFDYLNKAVYVSNETMPTK